MATPLRIFLNYRREDTAGYAGRLYDALADRFSAGQVFIDIDNIEPGVDFVEVIENAVGACDVFIALIGQRWVEVMNERGGQRLEDENDFVRLEIEAALKRELRVIPVLVQGARMPRPSELPESLAPLTRRNALEISDHRWRYDVEQLVQALERRPPEPSGGVTPGMSLPAGSAGPPSDALPAGGNGGERTQRPTGDGAVGGGHLISGRPVSPRPWWSKWRLITPVAAALVVLVVLLVALVPSSGHGHGNPGPSKSSSKVTKTSLVPSTRSASSTTSTPSTSTQPSTTVPNTTASSFAAAGWAKTVLAHGPADLTSVSCASPTFCMVGDEDGNVFSFDGSHWSGPQDVDGSDGLNSLSCPSPAFCAGADEFGDVVSYSGGTWSAPVDVDRPNALYAISCVSSSFCAAGSDTGDAFTYNGQTWSGGTQLGTYSIDAVSCPTSSFCMAVAGNGYAYSYNGSKWSSAVGADVGSSLNGVSCPTEKFCAAVDVTGAGTTFNGNTWSQVRPVNLPVNGPGDLYGVSCPHPSFCVAVGQDGDGQSFDASAWSKPAAIDNLTLDGVSCPDPAFCVAVQGEGHNVTGYGPGSTVLVWRRA